MKSAVLTNAETIPSVESPNGYISEPAHRRLEALRSSVELRLAALEAALADPARGEALEGLILDLARVATEEAQASAANACVDTRLEAETLIRQARAAAQAAVEQEYAASMDVRRALEQARQQIATLEQEKADGLLSARESFTAELTRERALRTELERASAVIERSLAEAQDGLDSERAAAEQLRIQLDRMDGQLSALKQQYASATASHERTEEELARVRESVAERERSHAETQSELALERNTVADLRRAAAKAADQLTLLGRRESEARALHDQAAAAEDRTAADLVQERKALASLQQAHAELQLRLDAESAAGAGHRQALAEAEARANEALDAVAHAEARMKAAEDAATRAHERTHAAEEAAARAHERMKAAEDAATRADARMKAALEAERAADARLREAEAEGAGRGPRDGEHIAQADALHRQLEADLEAERGANADLRRAREEAQAHLEAERKASADVLRAHDELQRHLETERRANKDVQRVHDELQAHLEAERQKTADLRRAQQEAQARWDAERAANADGGQTAASIQERVQATIDELRDALSHSRAEVQTLRDDLEKARARVETLFGERADAERSLREAESRLKRATRERDELAAERETTDEALPAAAKTSSSATPLTVLPAPAYKPAHKPSAKAAAKPKEPDAGWVAVRLATRYGFRDPIDVQVNAAASQLCDLSVGGCQLLSATPLKPNQTVKVLLPFQPKPIVCAGKIVWAKLEAPALGRSAGYRAGVQFSRVDESAVEAFIAHQGAAELG